MKITKWKVIDSCNAFTKYSENTQVIDQDLMMIKIFILNSIKDKDLKETVVAQLNHVSLYDKTGSLALFYTLDKCAYYEASTVESI